MHAYCVFGSSKWLFSFDLSLICLPNRCYGASRTGISPKGGSFMSSANRRFFARQSLLSRSQSDRVREALAGDLALSLLDVMERAAYDVARRDASCAVERQSEPRRTEDFMLLYFERHARLVERLTTSGRVPLASLRLLALCFKLMRPEDGEVIARREDVVRRLRLSSRAVELAFKELLEAGALTRRRDPEAGKPGRGYARYFVNPKLATHLAEPWRSAAQAESPEVGNVVSLPSERRSRAPGIAPVVL